MKIYARWVQFLFEPGTDPPGEIRIGLLSENIPPRLLGDLYMYDIQHLPHAIESFLALFKSMNIALSPDFELIYPRYAVDEDLENQMHQIAWLIKDEADKHKWGFGRDLPSPSWD